MAKTLVALNDSKSFNKNLVSLASELFGNMDRELFVGLVVKDLSYIATVSQYMGEPAFADYMPLGNSIISDEDKRKANIISLFEENARKGNVKHEIYNDFHITLHELIKHSTYADLLILSYKVFYNPTTKRPDTTLLYQILSGSRCPVLIVPNGVSKIDNIIFTYDGKESSVFAIRAFTNLFAQGTSDKEVSILTVMPSMEEEIKNERLLLQLVKQQYKDVGLQLLEGQDISEEISNFSESVENPLVVMGAYGRSYISNLVIPSVAKNILKRSSIPLFIAHR